MSHHPYHPIKVSSLDGKNPDENETRHPIEMSSIAQDRDIKLKQRMVHNPLK